jgi:hypothetical protein
VTIEGIGMTDKHNDSDSVNVSWAELSTALLEFRDALMEVSLCLRDYQFDHDFGGRNEAAILAQELKEKFTVQGERSRRT